MCELINWDHIATQVHGLCFNRTSLFLVFTSFIPWCLMQRNINTCQQLLNCFIVVVHLVRGRDQEKKTLPIKRALDSCDVTIAHAKRAFGSKISEMLDVHCSRLISNFRSVCRFANSRVARWLRFSVLTGVVEKFVGRCFFQFQCVQECGEKQSFANTLCWIYLVSAVGCRTNRKGLAQP